jgi:hypothetical protein
MLSNVMLLLHLWNSSCNNSSNNSSNSNNSNRVPEEGLNNNSQACSSAPLLPLLKRLDKIKPHALSDQVIKRRMQKAVLRIRDILVRIRMLTKGSGCGSGSGFFCQ